MVCKSIIGATCAGVVTLGVVATSEAALSPTAILNFDDPVYDNNGLVTAGSSFGVDFTGDGIVDLSERTGLRSNDGLALGTTQPGSPTVPGIDQPWTFFGNPGIHKTTSAVTIISDDGRGNVELDFSGWTVNWNNIDIGLGGAAWGSNPDGIAQMTCATDCSIGESFSIFYTATVTDTTTGFQGVRYRLGFDSGSLSSASSVMGANLGGPVEDPGIIATGTIGASVVPVPATAWLFGSGLFGLFGVARRKKNTSVNK